MNTSKTAQSCATQQTKQNGLGLIVASVPERDAIGGQFSEKSTARESSSLLGISPRTVEFHRENIKEKLGVRSIAELTRIAVDAGMVPVAA